ncbi:MAG: monovalent cation/H+ antiporter complex subunit F [Candidatus Omnitrophica bacterium]|nr:monovalent cation/H+ antiporter complex subunit F [Candidatus Omnitrophota bacterium]MDD5236622.1 monovalent cation/H+ antiporter complex subunit F [Candidatus Omnitrophota bacterium]MDD5609993.1 monovalent cation/H+ antiporter complex subunit F [Candidatus Omnitrophota bacterium]
MMKTLRYFLGMILLLAALLLVSLYPLPSLLNWQSPFLAHCFFIFMLCFLICIIRIIIGPTSADRAVVINTLGIFIVGFCAILSIPTGRDWYLDIAIAWALQSFVGALAFAKYLEGRGFDE